MLRRVIFMLLPFMLFVGTVIASGLPAGKVNTIQGEAFVERSGSTLALEKGMRVFVEDLLVTGKDGSLGIVLEDNTIVSMGPESHLSLSEFIFVPIEGEFSLVLRMVKGTFIYISGIIAKLSPGSIKIETPVGVVAVRGTRFAAKIYGN